MDLSLPLLADANLHVSNAEDFASEQRFENARRELEKAEMALGDLHQLHAALECSEQGLLVAMAKPLAERARRVQALLPAVHPVSESEVLEDPEQEVEPEA